MIKQHWIFLISASGFNAGEINRQPVCYSQDGKISGGMAGRYENMSAKPGKWHDRQVLMCGKRSRPTLTLEFGVGFKGLVQPVSPFSNEKPADWNEHPVACIDVDIIYRKSTGNCNRSLNLRRKQHWSCHCQFFTGCCDCAQHDGRICGSMRIF